MLLNHSDRFFLSLFNPCSGITFKRNNNKNEVLSPIDTGWICKCLHVVISAILTCDDMSRWTLDERYIISVNLWYPRKYLECLLSKLIIYKSKATEYSVKYNIWSVLNRRNWKPFNGSFKFSLPFIPRVPRHLEGLLSTVTEITRIQVHDSTLSNIANIMGN